MKKKIKKLKPDQLERVQDAMQLVQSARESLSEVDAGLLPDRKAIEECFDMADRSLRDAIE
jgi:hypothetical protein